MLFVLPWQAAAAVWAGSGLLILWLSLQLQQRAAFVFGLVLQVIGAGAFLFGGAALFGDLPSEGLKPLAHMGFWTPAVLALAALVGAWRLHRASERERNLALGWSWAGAAFAVAAGLGRRLVGIDRAVGDRPLRARRDA